MKTKKNNICSPLNEDSFTCFSKKALIKIIRSWNNHKKNNKIEFSDNYSKYKLWSLLDNKLKKKCSSEYCWTKQQFLSPISKKLKKRYFRPKMPKEWYKDPREWLNTDDIENVLNQYNKKYKDFLFIGAVPIDFDHKFSPGNCVINELCNINIKKLQKKNINKIGVVFNLDKHDQEGSHWVSFFGDFNENKLYYFDSYGYEEPKEVKILVNRLIKQGKKIGKNIKFERNKKRNQFKKSECGTYSIYFIEQLLKNSSNAKILFNNVVKDDDMLKNRNRYYINKNNI